MGVHTLTEAVGHLTGEHTLEPVTPADDVEPSPASDPCLSQIKGQPSAKRALEVSAAGGHHVLLVGPPGVGKTMLARCLPGLLPPLTSDESLEVTKIYSRVALDAPASLITTPPFRAPHQSVSSMGLVGGGPCCRPGDLSLAHHGVLFLDELPGFIPETLAGLTKPLDEGVVDVGGQPGDHPTLPARVTLVAAMTPCPCGYLGDPHHECMCHWEALETHRGRVPGSLLDRIELHVDVPPVSLGELRGSGDETSERVRERVTRARERQHERQGCLNAQLSFEDVEQVAELDSTARHVLGQAFETLGLSGRAAHSVMRVARTLADLEGRGIGPQHVAEAVQYRALGRRPEEITP